MTELLVTLQGKKDVLQSIRATTKDWLCPPTELIEWLEKQIEIAELTKSVYQWGLDKGIAKEQARIILPEGMTISRMYMNGTLRSWIHYIELRSGNGTQKEHREVAIACAKQIAKIFPMIMEFVC